MRTERAPGAPRLKSRIHGPRRVLAELGRLSLKTASASAYRATTAAERLWCARVGDALEALITEGRIVLPGGEDPSDRRRVRKRPVKMF